MLIGIRQRFVFAANTKAASSAIERALAPYAEIQRTLLPAQKHASLDEIACTYAPLLQRLGVDPAEMFVFGIVREPVDWLLSWYRYRRGNRVEAPLPPEMSFEDFFRARDWNIVRADGRPYLQSDVFADRTSTFARPTLYAYERLAEHWPRIARKIAGRDLPLARVNVSRLDDRPALSDAFAAELADFYAADHALHARAA